MYKYNFESFTTLCEIHIGVKNRLLSDYLYGLIYNQTKKFEEKYGFFSENSLLYKINHRTKNIVPIDDEFKSLIQIAFFYYEKTNGAFDVTIDGTIKLEQNNLIFSNNETKIDFRGLVKEYAVDSAIYLLKEYKVDSALVNFGGDIASIGMYNNECWNIGIENPYNSNENILTVEMNNNSLCTSGHSKRYKMINNEKVSYIIVKEANKYMQISVMAPTTVDAGVWSTALLSKPSLEIPSHIKVLKRV